MTTNRDETSGQLHQARQLLDRCYVELTGIREELEAAESQLGESEALLEAMGLVAIAAETVDAGGEA